MKQVIHFLFLLFLVLFTHGVTLAQNIGIGVNPPDGSAMLDITSTNRGLLIPRMTSANINAISNPAKGLLVYDSTQNQLLVNMGTPSSPIWQSAIVSGGDWSLDGNNGTTPGSQFLGTTDNKALHFRVNNIWAGEIHPKTGNVFFGLKAGKTNTTGYSNVAIGNSALASNIGAQGLIAIGDSALFNNGSTNILSGSFDGVFNTAVGYKSMYATVVGSTNTAVGSFSLTSNTNGVGNVAVGSSALEQNTTGGGNTSNGGDALRFNTSGNNNTADGIDALYFNTTGTDNTAVGATAMDGNRGSLGSFNTAIGSRTMGNTSNSQFNTVVGYNSGSQFDMGYNNTILGANCDINATGLFNCIAIGQAVVCTASSQARIGNLATNSIGGQVGWTTFSDGRYKKDINDDVIGINFIMKLRPVTYHLDITSLNNKLIQGRKIELDAPSKNAITEKEKMRFSGFVAQEVEKAASESGYDFSGVDKPKNENDFYGLRYGDFVVPLVKAVQELNIKVEKLEKENAQLKTGTSFQGSENIETIISRQQAVIEDLQKRLQIMETLKKTAFNN